MQIIVLSMRHSGAEVLAQLLSMMGAYFAPEATMLETSAAGCSSKFYERSDVIAINERILQAMWGVGGWQALLNGNRQHVDAVVAQEFKQEITRIIAKVDGHRPWMIKDPRLCLTLPWWQAVLEVPVCILVYRQPVHIALDLLHHENIPLDVGMALWEAYTVAALYNTRNIPCITIAYETIVADLFTSAAKLHSALQAYGVEGLRMPRSKELFLRYVAKNFSTKTKDGCDVIPFSQSAGNTNLALTERQLGLWNAIVSINTLAYPLEWSQQTLALLASQVPLKLLALYPAAGGHASGQKITTTPIITDSIKHAVLATKTQSLTKTNITYAWELGNSFGHVGAFLPVAMALKNQEIAVHWVVPHTQMMTKLLGGGEWHWLQTPKVRERRGNTSPLSFADIMMRFGFANPNDLRRIVIAWRELFSITQPKVVLADHAPAAILAAYTMGLPVMLYSYGFCVPPRLSPLPPLRSWQPVEPGVLATIEQTVLTSINSVARDFSKSGFNAVYELYDVAETGLVTCPDLDHYKGQRGDCSYWGSVFASITDWRVNWPTQVGPRILAYLRRDSPYAEAVIMALYEMGVTAIVIFPDAPSELKVRCMKMPNLTLSDRLTNLDSIIRDVDIAITYGGHGLTAALLLAGKPLLVLPTQLEQFILARHVVELGAGLLLHPQMGEGNVRDSIELLLGRTQFFELAQVFAQQNSKYEHEHVVAGIIQRIRQLC